MIGPSNPVVSIGPILAADGLRSALASAPAPVVAVSPLVGGEVIKGPTAAFMQWAGQPLDSDGIAASTLGCSTDWWPTSRRSCSRSSRRRC